MNTANTEIRPTVRTQLTTKMVREPLELILIDLCGVMLEKSLGGARYFIMFHDDATRRGWAYSLKTKDEVLNTFT